MFTKPALQLKNLAGDFLSLVYPQLCLACEGPLYRHERSLCTRCAYALPRTGFHLEADNPVARIFYGRVRLHAASAFLRFQKDGSVQRLVHQLKYKGRKEAGEDAGRLYGAELKSAPLFSDVAAVIPVPLHPTKLRKRGYNQAECFARGLSEAMSVKLDTETLHRKTATSTQTRKNRFQRWRNVEEVFALRASAHLEGKHLLLVDDVVTTGATLESCAALLLKIPNARVSIAALATAQL